MNIMKVWLVTAGLLIGLGTGLSAHAQAKGYVGGLVGMSVPDADDTSARLAYGILGGARLDGEWGIGGYYFTSSKEEDVGANKVDFNYTLYGVEGSFHFENIADGAYFGARVGMAKVDVGTLNFSPSMWGLHFGYDAMLNDHLSLGGEVGFLSVGSDTASNQKLDSFTMLNFLAALKFWF